MQVYSAFFYRLHKLIVSFKKKDISMERENEKK